MIKLQIDSREKSDLAELVIKQATKLNIPHEKVWLEIGDYTYADVCFEAKSEILDGKNLLILSDKNISKVNAPIPSLLAASAVHHYLIKEGLRMKASIIVETGEARELHHFAVLAGYGVEAINPYLVFDTIKSLVDKSEYKEAEENFIKASGKAILKIMSKMGISTLKSYCGAQIFDAVGISQEVIDLVWEHCAKDDTFTLILDDFETWVPPEDTTFDTIWGDSWIFDNPMTYVEYQTHIQNHYADYCDNFGFWGNVD